MLTSNYYKIQRAMYQRDWMFSGVTYSGREDDRYCLPINYNGNGGMYAVNDNAGTNLTDNDVGMSNTNSVTVVCGSGSTRTPTAADNDLENDNTALFTTISTTCSVGITDSGITRTFIRVLRNDTNSPITISEVGICKATQTSFTYKAFYFLIQRSLLDTEVEVAPGKTATIQIAITEGNDTVQVS